MNNALVQILLLAAMGEAVWQTLKLVWEKDTTKKLGKFHPDKIGALAVGILIAFGSGLDLTAMLGIPMSIPYLGVILTGILISRGAGFVHDLLTYLKSLKEILITKADNAVTERNNTGLVVNAKNLAPGTKVDINTPEAISVDVVDKKGPMDKTRDMISAMADKTSKVIKVIRSTPEVDTKVYGVDEPAVEPADTPPETPQPESDPSLNKAVEPKGPVNDNT